MTACVVAMVTNQLILGCLVQKEGLKAILKHKERAGT